MDRVAGLAQLVRERVEALGLALCVVEQEYLSHFASFLVLRPANDPK